MSKKLVEISLKSLEIKENGEIEEEEKGNNLLTVSLIYPSHGNPILSTVKALKLTDNQRIDFEKGINPETKKPYTYADKILFKEVIEEESMILIQLTDVVKLSGIERFIGKLFKGLFKASFGYITGSISNVLFSSPVETVSGLHQDSIDLDKGDTAYTVGKSSKPILTSDLPQYLDFQLEVPKNIKRPHFVYEVGREVYRKKEIVLSETKNNGKLTLRIKELKD